MFLCFGMCSDTLNSALWKTTFDVQKIGTVCILSLHNAQNMCFECMFGCHLLWFALEGTKACNVPLCNSLVHQIPAFSCTKKTQVQHLDRLPTACQNLNQAKLHFGCTLHWMVLMFTALCIQGCMAGMQVFYFLGICPRMHMAINVSTNSYSIQLQCI